MQNSTFLVLFRPIFAPKMKTAPPPPPDGIGKQKLWRTCRYLDQNKGVFFIWSSSKVGENLLFLFRRSPNFGRKTRLNFGEDLFFGRSSEFDRKTAPIWFKTDENLGQVRLLLFQASKKAPPPFRETLATRLWVTEALRQLNKAVAELNTEKSPSAAKN